jgi:hypothetical protein
MSSRFDNPTSKNERAREVEPPYARYAFLNPYNLALFCGAILLGLLSGHHWIVVLGCAFETMWMIFAPDSKILRRVWFDRVFERAERAFVHERRLRKLSELEPQDRARLAHLEEQTKIIERLAKENPSLAIDLLHDELVKLDALLEEFVDLALLAARGERHATTFDFNAMRRSWQFHEQQVKAYQAGDPRREVAQKNLEVLRQRRARWDDLSRSLQVARGQMELIEQTFRLLADEIMTISSPHELGGRIDELRIAVEAVRETAGETFAADLEMDIIEEENGREARHR